MDIFSDKLKELRINKNLKQSDMANILEISMQSYSTYENGREPNYTMVCKIAEFFNVSTDYLFGVMDDFNHVNIEISKITGLSNKAIEALKLNKRHSIDSEHSIINFINLILEEHYDVEINTEVDNKAITKKVKSGDPGHMFSKTLIQAINKYLKIQTNEKVLRIERNNKNIYVLENEYENTTPLGELIPLDELILDYYIDGMRDELIELKRKYNKREGEQNAET